MKLHQDRDASWALIFDISRKTDICSYIIEIDYYSYLIWHPDKIRLRHTLMEARPYIKQSDAGRD